MKRVYEGDLKERRRKSVAVYRAKDPERSRKQWRKYKEKSLITKTGGEKRPEICDVCGDGGKINGRHGSRVNVCYDHCHVSGEFRGWLCMRCNVVLGKVKDDIHVLIYLAVYLEDFAQKQQLKNQIAYNEMMKVAAEHG